MHPSQRAKLLKLIDGYLADSMDIEKIEREKAGLEPQPKGYSAPVGTPQSWASIHCSERAFEYCYKRQRDFKDCILSIQYIGEDFKLVLGPWSLKRMSRPDLEASDDDDDFQYFYNDPDTGEPLNKGSTKETALRECQRIIEAHKQRESDKICTQLKNIEDEDWPEPLKKSIEVLMALELSKSEAKSILCAIASGQIPGARLML